MKYQKQTCSVTTVSEPSIIDRLVRSRRRTLTVQISNEGRVIVRAPRWGSLSDIHRFVNKQLPWIRAKQRAIQQARSEIVLRRYQDGDAFLYLGDTHTLTVLPESKQPLTWDFGGFLLGDFHRADGPRAFEQWYRAQARELLTERLQSLAGKWGYRYSKLLISGARTRWGSCSTKATISLSWRLIMAPLWVIDYVVVHELAHLKHPNHSPRFWNEVQRLCVDYKNAKRWLNANQSRLTWEE